MTRQHTAWTLRPAGGPPLGAHMRRAVLGDQEIVWSGGKLGAERIERVTAAQGRAAGAVGSGAVGSGAVGSGAVGSATQLGLITQVGGAFQLEHPDVPILVDRGRHLIVDLADLPTAEAPEHTCWRAEPLVADAVIVQPSTAARMPAQPAVTDLLGLLDPVAVHADLQTLVGFGTRHSLRPGFVAACAFATTRLTELGYRTTAFPITVNGSASQNVIADRVGSGPADRGVVLITAHLDSINIAGGPNAPAPGADDNGSGSAALLELARVLATQKWSHDLRLILFGGEEEGLFGSKQYVAALPADQRSRIRAVLNMDMVGTRNTADSRVLLEGAALSQSQIDDLAAAAATYTDLITEVSLNPFASDHVPFLQAGVPAVLTIEGADSANTHIHSAADVMVHIDVAYVTQILRMNLAAVAGWLGLASPTSRPGPAGSVVSREPGEIDLFVIGPDSALYHRSFGAAGWQPGFRRVDGST